MLEGWWAAVVCVLVWAAGAGGEMARLWKRSGQGLTSSTLKWVDAEAGESLPPGALQADEGVGVWCRFPHHGHVAGMVGEDGVCYAPFLEEVVPANKYEVLVSLNGSARLLELEWSRSAAMIEGGVQVSKQRLLALARTPEGMTLPGFVDAASRRAYMLTLNSSRVVQFEDAKILSEDEPVRYAVDGVAWDETRATLTHMEDLPLLNLTLQNPEAEARVVAKQVEYTNTETLYWGSVRATVKGLSTVVTGPGGQVWNLTWGVENDYKREVHQTVSLEVPAGAAVDVSLVGVMQKYEAPYTAHLTAVYSDGERLDRPVTAMHHHKYLAELRADFSRPRGIDDGQELEGDFPTSEVLVASTTTTSTTTTTPAPPGTGPEAEKTGSLATAETNPSAAPGLLPSALLAACLAALARLARP